MCVCVRARGMCVCVCVCVCVRARAACVWVLQQLACFALGSGALVVQFWLGVKGDYNCELRDCVVQWFAFKWSHLSLGMNRMRSYNARSRLVAGLAFFFFFAPSAH